MIAPQIREKARWVIVGRNGILYTGQWLTRAEAIAQHTADLFGGLEFAINGKLSRQQRRDWRRCTDMGDRAVKATISWAE